MDFQEELQKRVQYELSHTLPSVSLDMVIFGFHQDQLKVLLLRLKESNDWLLPGGRVRKDEDLDDAAFRSLSERTGLEHLFLQQFHTFGKVNRLTHYSLQETLDRMQLTSLVATLTDQDAQYWSYRDISVGYYALVEFTKVNLASELAAEECRWWSIDQIPPLLFDHNEMIQVALKTLRRHLKYQPIGYSLLPEPFTMTELQILYETILGRSLDRRNFYKQMMHYDVLERLEKRPTIPSSKAPYLYRFNKERYDQKLSDEDFHVG